MKSIENKIFALLICLFSVVGTFAQTPVPMASQSGLSYTEDFADIANWTNGFASGTGANRFGAVAVNATGTIPDGVRVSTSTATFQTGTTGGVQRGTSQTPSTQSIVLLSTGGADNSSSAAIDFFMDFTGVNAGTLSFNWASVNNSTGNRAGSLRVYASTDGVSFQEISTAQVLNFVNNTLTSGSITSVALPASFNNSATARLRFYYHNGSGGSTGSRPKISIDNLNVTAAASQPNLSVNDVTAAEGNSGSGNFTFTVSLSAPAGAGGVTFDIATADGTATVLDSDYATASTTGASIAAGQQTATFTVAVAGDTVVEPDETFFVNITNVTGATALDAQGLGTMQNDDVALPVISFQFATYAEDEAQTLVVLARRTGDLSGTSSVEFTTALDNLTGAALATGGTSCAQSGVDYVTTTSTLTFNPNDTLMGTSIQICSDLLFEPTEAFPLILFSPTNATIGPVDTIFAEINDTASQFASFDSINIGLSNETSQGSISVTSGLSTIFNLRVTLFDVEFPNSENLDVLLVGPQGQKMLLMADAGGASGLSGRTTLTFDDNAGQVLPDSSLIVRGSYEPTTWEPGQTSFLAPAPVGPYVEPGSTVGGPITLGSVFAGTNPNGTWTLYVRNDLNAFEPVGVAGGIGGWGLQFLAPTAAGVSVSGMVRSGKVGIPDARVTVAGGDLTQAITTRTNSFGNYTIEGLAAGQTYVVTVDSRRYTFTQPTQILTVTDNVTELDFVANDW